MSVAPTPQEAFDRAVKEGDRRLGQSMIELLSTGFIAGLTVIFGMVALGTVEALLSEASHGIRRIGGALAFGLGVVFLVVGRAELFSENFFDPVATIVERRKPGMVMGLLRLWSVTFLLNLVGGGFFAWILSVEGALPEGAPAALVRAAEEIAARENLVFFVKAIAGGALVTLLSFLLQAVNSVGSRIALAYMVGVLLAIGPFDHVIVTALHVLFGIFFDARVGIEDFVRCLLIVTAGNLVGGLGLVTLTHIAQAEE
nr:formate/nitrite transporter family protein [Paracoccus saliphilus]